MGLGRGEGQTQTSSGLGLEGAELRLVGGETLMSAGPGSAGGSLGLCSAGGITPECSGAGAKDQTVFSFGPLSTRRRLRGWSMSREEQ